MGILVTTTITNNAHLGAPKAIRNRLSLQNSALSGTAIFFRITEIGAQLFRRKRSASRGVD
jgi:hypothetical protein